MKKLLLVIVLASLFLASCQQLGLENNEDIVCTKDAKQCPDGSYVGRVPPDCNFEACPSGSNDDSCDYPENAYLSKDPEKCSTMKFQCIPGTEPFNNECGCGCAPSEEEGERTLCNPDQRNVDFCTREYRPVCGWFSQDVQCIREPCADTYSNPCMACNNEDVAYYTEGECSQQ